MSSAMYVAKTGLDAQQNRMNVISNNLANVNTTGFKKDRANFETLLYQTVRAAGSQTSADTELASGFTVGTGVRIVNSDKSYMQGNLQMTENALDLAIDGGGFFQVLMPDGSISYTRDGTFTRSSEGILTTSSGYEVQPTINIPEDALGISVSSDGIVAVRLPGQTEESEVGQLELANFPNIRGLAPRGENFVTETEASGAPILSVPAENGLGKVVQGALEASNVNVIEELVAMIETQRAYEINSKAISSIDQMMQFVSNNL
jgi:flagellar basal-body rod protein FlgG